ncbi:MAG: hypothetical protein LBT67_02920 [Holosporaceae bacterium]|jgi:hypothetical protein|nr:hypothetical protein [Holosporaceae bacterium]
MDRIEFNEKYGESLIHPYKKVEGVEAENVSVGRVYIKSLNYYTMNRVDLKNKYGDYFAHPYKIKVQSVNAENVSVGAINKLYKIIIK